MLKMDWDQPIPDSLQYEFVQFFQQFHLVRDIQVPRRAVLSTYVKLEIHGFAGAAARAYGAAIFLKSTDPFGKHYVALLCSKSRVAPVKTITIARLELCGALLLAKLVTRVRESIKIDINNDNINLWTDSSIVLYWLVQEPSTWTVFVANRVSAIQTLTNIKCWKHVSTTHNPADIISRGCNPKDLLSCKLWWSG